MLRLSPGFCVVGMGAGPRSIHVVPTSLASRAKEQGILAPFVAAVILVSDGGCQWERAHVEPRVPNTPFLSAVSLACMGGRHPPHPMTPPCRPLSTCFSLRV